MATGTTGATGPTGPTSASFTVTARKTSAHVVAVVEATSREEAIAKVVATAGEGEEVEVMSAIPGDMTAAGPTGATGISGPTGTTGVSGTTGTH